MAKDERFAELDDGGHITRRQHNTIPAKIHGDIQDVPRRTEDNAFDNLAYGDRDTPISEAQIIENLLKTGRFAICTRCRTLLPADRQNFRADSSKLRGFTQPCRRCDAKLRGLRRLRKNVTYRFYKRALAKKAKG